MDSTILHGTLPTAVLTLISFCLFLLSFYFVLWKAIRTANKRNCSNPKAPEAAGGWPILGHLHLFRGQGLLLHKIFGAMAEKHGPAFTIRLGVRPALVVSSWEVAKECFTTNDRALASRPTSLALKIMGYNNGLFSFAPYGQYWRELRKIVMHELLSSRRLELLKNVWFSEIDIWIKGLYGNSLVNKVVDMKQWFGELMMNIAVRLVAGKRSFGKIREGDGEEAKARQRQIKALRDFFRLVEVFMIEDAFPFLTWLDPQGYQKEMKNIAKELDYLLEEWLEEHKLKQQAAGDDQSKDFMDVMLTVVKDSTITDRDANTICKATCLNVILAAIDTTTVTLTWAFSLLLNNRRVLKKAQEELNAQVGKDKHVEESDMKNLAYLHAIIKEVLRLYPAAPLLGARESLEDTVVLGYHVPKGTRVIVNVWKIQRDPSAWSDPLEFRPERFLSTDKHVDVWGQNFELIPFGSGRRMCPGIPFALQVVSLTLARLLHGFELTTPGGLAVDMTETSGLTNMKATSVEVFLIPNLPHQLYA